MICVFRHDSGGLALALAFWMTSYYIVTSSSIESLSLLVAFPIFLAATKAGADSAVSKGVFVCLVIWSLYIIPGNSFGYKVIEILDPYIMGSVEIYNILPSICLIASRYILPVVVIFAILRLKGENSSLTPVLAVAALPVVWAIGFRLSLIAFAGSAEYPWSQMQRITVLAIYLCLLICGFLLVSILFRLRKWESKIGQNSINIPISLAKIR